MKEKLQRYLEKEQKLNGALIGVDIRSAISGDSWFQYNNGVRFHPASNMKLLTAAAALQVLGENYKFVTEIQTDGIISGNQLNGNLYLVGKGDPTIQVEDFAAFAKKIKKKGIDSINGDIIGDDTWYDAIRLSSDITWRDEQYHYGAEISALTVSPNSDFDTGSVVIEITPTIIGKAPIVSVFPFTNYITVRNEAITVEKAKEDELVIEREHGGNRITVKGKITYNSSPITEVMAVWEVSKYAIELFSQALEKYAISWTGTVKCGKAPHYSSILIIRKSIPLSELLVPFMKLSNNGIAEILIKEIGQKVYGEGSWEKGIDVMEQELMKLGMDMKNILIKDGSGISQNNLIPATELATLLYKVQEKKWFPIFLNALPIAGHEDRMIGGTLRERLKGISVKAKTGTIEGVSTLSGYIVTKREKKIIFSLMVNNLLDEEIGKTIEDEIIEIVFQEF